LEPVIQEAVARWTAAGADPALLGAARFEIGNLNAAGHSSYLGLQLDRQTIALGNARPKRNHFLVENGTTWGLRAQKRSSKTEPPGGSQKFRGRRHTTPSAVGAWRNGASPSRSDGRAEWSQAPTAAPHGLAALTQPHWAPSPSVGSLPALFDFAFFAFIDSRKR
jgi:hypothetical protein